MTHRTGCCQTQPNLRRGACPINGVTKDEFLRDTTTFTGSDITTVEPGSHHLSLGRIRHQVTG